MPLSMYIVSGVGILSIVLVVYFAFGNDTAHFSSDQEVDETAQRVLKESINFDEYLYNVDKTIVFALNREKKHLAIAYAHGIHKNLESIPPRRFRSCSLRNKGDEHVVLNIQIESFDRPNFDMELPVAQKAEAEQWLDTIITFYPKETTS